MSVKRSLSGVAAASAVAAVTALPPGGPPYGFSVDRRSSEQRRRGTP
jgi:hypothetical protein